MKRTLFTQKQKQAMNMICWGSEFLSKILSYGLLNEIKIVFIDPKWLRNIDDGFNNPKLRLYETLKKLPVNDMNVVLDAYIIAPANYNYVWNWKWQESEDDFEKRHVIFQRGDYIGRMMEMIMKC